MNLYRLTLNDNINDILVEAPSRRIIDEYVNSPGDIGYNLYEILLSFHELNSIKLNEELGAITDKDSIIRFHKYKIE